jgi:hypothetical protein
MSEYQHYDFQAIDRPLTVEEMSALRRHSSRARITPTRFVNDYSYGSFKGDSSEWMEKYFDAFLYRASWGTFELSFRLPARLLPLAYAKPYRAGDILSARAAGDHVVLELRSGEDGGAEWIEEDDGTLSSLVPLRADLASGDLRALYLAWLLAVQLGEVDPDDLEPFCPPGLASLSAPLEALVELFRLDRDLLEAAAGGSPAEMPPDEAALERWVAALPEKERTAMLVRVASGGAGHVRAELLRRFREDRQPGIAGPSGIRTAATLLASASERAAERERRKAAGKAREQARLERAATEARDRKLQELSKRETAAWREVDALIATRQPRKYEEAVELLRDLRALCQRDGRPEEARFRIAALRSEHEKKGRLVDRLRAAGLLA